MGTLEIDRTTCEVGATLSGPSEGRQQCFMAARGKEVRNCCKRWAVVSCVVSTPPFLAPPPPKVRSEGYKCASPGHWMPFFHTAGKAAVSDFLSLPPRARQTVNLKIMYQKIIYLQQKFCSRDCFSFRLNSIKYDWKAVMTRVSGCYQSKMLLFSSQILALFKQLQEQKYKSLHLQYTNPFITGLFYPLANRK